MAQKALPIICYCFGKQCSPDGIDHNAMQFTHHSEVQGFRVVLQYFASQYKLLHHSALNCVAAAPYPLNCITVQNTASQCITLSTVLHSPTSIALQYVASHYKMLHHSALQCIAAHYSVLHSSPTHRPGALLVGATSLGQVGSACALYCLLH